MNRKKLRTILLVDDDFINNYINKRLLENLDIAEEIKVALNGQEALDCLEDHCFKSDTLPEIILLDINMPVMNGFEFLKNFNSNDFDNKKGKIAIAILTTSYHANDRTEMQRLGIRFYINKPLTKEKLLHLLEDLK